MTQHPAFRRAFVITMILFSPLIYLSAVADARSAPMKQEPCQLSTSGPTFFGGKVGYTAGAYCPGAEVIQWKLTINRSGLPWATNSGVITSQPRVSKRCVRTGPPITLRPILRVVVWYSPSLKHTRTYRGAVISTRCAQ